MIVRVRTNLETKRIKLSQDDPTFLDLRKAIAGEFSIDPGMVFLSFDFQNEQPLELNDASTLAEGDISHGTMLYLTGRMEKNDKSFIDGDGDISHKGINSHLKNLRECHTPTITGPRSKKLCLKRRRQLLTRSRRVQREEPNKGVPEPPAPVESISSSISGDGAAQCDKGGSTRDNIHPHGNDGSPSVRAPDEQRRERLVDDFSGITPPRDVRFAASGMYSEMSPALAVAMALSRLEKERA